MFQKHPIFIPKNQQIRRHLGFTIFLNVSSFCAVFQINFHGLFDGFRQKKSSNHRKMMMVLPKTAFFDGLEPRHAD
nr:MAG TPA: hypothetical protein [Caudoviricetes sp.]